jgi:uncharacterized protein
MTRQPFLEPLESHDCDGAWALNNAHAEQMNEQSRDDFRAIVARAYLALGNEDCFMIAFDDRTDYHSPNFLWFKARHPRFAYVDRIAVAAHARGSGAGRLLYEELFRKARADGHTLVACEVNSQPPNPGSDAFHARMGFEVVGEAAVYGDDRRVRYMLRRL